MTIIVGPNNSGKSLLLREIDQYCRIGPKARNRPTARILQELTFESLEEKAAKSRIERSTLAPNPNHHLRPGELVVGKGQDRYSVNHDEMLHSLMDPNNATAAFCKYYLSYNTLFLNGPRRIDLVGEQEAGDLQQSPTTSFQVLFQDKEKREAARRIVHDALGLYLVVDPTNLGRLRLRLSRNKPVSPLQESGIHPEAVAFHGAATLIQDTSDGVMAFVGMVTEVIAGEPLLLLIDEPETFLHPALCFRLGKELALASSGADKRLFVATHNPNFLMGCIQSGVSIGILRLTYQSNVPTARQLSSSDLLTSMRNPLLRSTNILDALFYDFVIVTEGDADRAFYQEVNERLVALKTDSGIRNCLFVNAQNKQTVSTIMKPLRQLGIPAACVVDIDVLKEGGSVWRRFLEGGFVPALEYPALATLRNDIMTEFDATGKDMKRDGGVDLLTGGGREAANNLFEKLQEYGLFVVRRGELESWLPELGAAGHGPAWLVSIFQKMGEDPDEASYLTPGEDGVWSFVAEIRRWFLCASRKGVPL